MPEKRGGPFHKDAEPLVVYYPLDIGRGSWEAPEGREFIVNCAMSEMPLTIG
jgi:hypothetical protein